jgi:hypothetical protein
MRARKSRLLGYAAIAAVIAVTANLIAASVLLKTASNAWLIFSALGVGASLAGAFITLISLQNQSIEKDKSRVFISYAGKDEARAELLYKKLQAEGFEPWMDVKHLSADENWLQGIERALENSDYLVTLVSKNSLDTRGFTEKEMKFVLDLLDQRPRQNIHIISALLDDAQIPEPLTKFQKVNLSDDNGFSDLISVLQSSSEEGEK